jgi:hypothetical protein
MDRICTLHASIYLPLPLPLSIRTEPIRAKRSPSLLLLLCNRSIGRLDGSQDRLSICLRSSSNGDHHFLMYLARFHFARCGFPSRVMLALRLSVCHFLRTS